MLEALDGSVLSGWLVGLGIGAVVVVVVVVVVTTIIQAARRIEQHAGAAVRALETAQTHTGALWELRTTNEMLDAITRQCQAARSVLEGRR